MSQFEERCLWSLHKSPRDHIDHLLGTPRDHSVIFNKMVEEGSLVQNFRFRGFPSKGMESPRQPVTMPFLGDNPPADPEPTTVWTRGYKHPPGGQMMYGGRPVDNTHRQRGLSNPRHDPAPETWMDTGRGYQGRSGGLEPDMQQLKWEIMQDLQRNRERKKIYSPQQDSRQGRRSQDQYQPSFGGSPAQNGLDLQSRGGGERSRRRDNRGIPVTDFLKHEDFEGQPYPRQNGSYHRSSHGEESAPKRDARGVPADPLQRDGYGGQTNPVQNGLDLQSRSGGERSAKRDGRGIPVTDFLKNDKFEGQTYQGQNGLDRQSSHGGERSMKRDGRGIPVTDFMKRDKFEAAPSQERSPGKGYRLPEEPDGDLFRTRRSWGETPGGDNQGRNNANGYRNSEKERSPGRGYRLPEEPEGDFFSSRRPGGGSPMVDDQGRNRTNVFGNFEKRREGSELERAKLSQRVFRDDLVKGIQEQKDKRNQDVRYRREPETDLADLMRRSEVGRPKVDPNTGTLANQHLSRSDVSKVKMNYQPRDKEATEKYRVFLRQQMEDRERGRQEERQRLVQEAGQHFRAADNQWGHRGGGAPQNYSEHRRLKLDLENTLQASGNAQTFRKNNAPYATGFTFNS